MNTQGKVTVRGANRLFLIGMIMQFVVGIVISVMVVLFYAITGQGEPEENVITYVLLVFTQLLAVLLPSIIYVKYKGVNIKDTLRLKPLKPLHILLIAMIGLAGQYIAQFLNWPVLVLLDLIGEIPPSPIPVPDHFGSLIVSIVIVGVMPAVCEEIMMRGIVLPAYEIRGTKAGIVLSALLFGFMHGDIKNLVGPIFFGIVFGYLVVRTGSIFAGILAHFVNNAFAMTMEYLYGIYWADHAFLNSFAFFLLMLVASLVVFIAALVLFNRTTALQPKSSISAARFHLKAAFINIPVLVTMGIYIILQVFVITEIIRGGQ